MKEAGEINKRSFSNLNSVGKAFNNSGAGRPDQSKAVNTNRIDLRNKKARAIRGLCIRGGAEIALEWQEGKLLKCCLTAKHPLETELLYGERKVRVSLAAGEKAAIPI